MAELQEAEYKMFDLSGTNVRVKAETVGAAQRLVVEVLGAASPHYGKSGKAEFVPALKLLKDRIEQAVALVSKKATLEQTYGRESEGESYNIIFRVIPPKGSEQRNPSELTVISDAINEVLSTVGQEFAAELGKTRQELAAEEARYQARYKQRSDQFQRGSSGSAIS